MFVKREYQTRIPNQFLLAAAIALASLTSCAPVQPLPTAAPLEKVTVEYTPALRGIEPYLAACAEEVPGLGLVLNETPATAIDPDGVDFSLRLGMPSDPAGFSASIGALELKLIANAANPIQELTLEQLTSLYARQPGEADTGNKVFNYLPGDDLRQAIEGLMGLPAGRMVEELPSQAAAAEMVAGNESAFAFVAANFEDAEIKVIELSGIEASDLQIPVLALAAQEPSGMARSLLACLQAQPITSLP